MNPSARTKKTLKKLEKQFNLAKDTIEEATSEVEVVEVVEAELVEDNAGSELTVINPEDPEEDKPEFEVFGLPMLKEDFMMVRGQLMRLINTGQKIITEAGTLDIGDLKSSQIDALSSLQTALGSNLKLLIDIYDKINKIEAQKNSRSRGGQAFIAPQEGGGNVNVDKAIVFTGTTAELLDMMDGKK